LRLEQVDLGRVIEDAILLSSPVLETRKIGVKIKLAKGCPKIYGDSGYLHQVFLNLLNNSADAMPRECNIFVPRWTFVLPPEVNWGKMRDTGVVHEHAQVDYIFDSGRPGRSGSDVVLTTRPEADSFCGGAPWRYAGAVSSLERLGTK